MGIQLNRLQAMAMLKGLVRNDLVEPSYISMVNVKPDKFQIQIRSDYKKEEIDAYARKHGLTIKEDKESKYLVIYKP